MAQTLIGYVRDAVTKEPLPNAHVYIMRDGVPHGTTTNLDGSFMLEGVELRDNVMVSYVGYGTVKFSWDGGPVEVQLAPGVDLDEVVITPEADNGTALAIAAAAAAALMLFTTGEDKPTAL